MIEKAPKIKKCKIQQECKHQKIEKCGSDEQGLRKRTGVFVNSQANKVAKTANGRPTAKRNTPAAAGTKNFVKVMIWYSGGRYKDSNEPWIQCLACHEWAHIGCAGAARMNPVLFVNYAQISKQSLTAD